MRGLFIAFLLMATTSSFTQALIARSSLGATTFYTDINSAITASIAGDTLYLPGKNFEGFTLDKPLVIFGAGYDVDSTTATKKTYVSGSSRILNTASGGLIEGIHFVSLFFGSNASNQVVTNFTIKRCFIESNFAFGYSFGVDNTTASTNIIAQNVIYQLDAGGATNNLFSNNVIYNFLSHIGNNCLISNNVFASNYIALLTSTYGSDILNNIFLSNGGGAVITYSNFQNNIRTVSADFITNYGATNTSSGNFLGVLESTIFVNYTDGSPISQFFLQDFHLNAGSPYTGAGTDGTDVGIYGGIYPWKEGGLPQNPHVNSKNIPSVTDADGNLIINVNVNAQDK